MPDIERTETGLVAVLIPCCNEEATIKQVVTDFHDALPYARILIGDNNCTDRTVQNAKEAWEDVEIVPCPVQGKGAAVRTLIRYLYADRYVLVDGDGTYPASCADNLLYASRINDLMAIGMRELTGENNGIVHRFGNAFLNAAVSLRCRSRTLDCLTGYRVLPGWLAKAFAERSTCNGFEIEAELTMFCLLNNLPDAVVPCPYYPRPANSPSKLHAVRDGLKILKTIITYKNPGLPEEARRHQWKP